ncbi:hypothetical protein [Hungatella sp.]|uniref:hypothetical protein n=1 Tax=Hungatella sp. TaxID=2613924 RepID=UPI002A7FED16|nr:hypothetical protein [Hungatella sp.]
MMEVLLINRNLVKKMVDKLEKKHPLLCLLIFQMAVALFLIAAVGGIALIGGSVIWLFYHFVGMI